MSDIEIEKFRMDVIRVCSDSVGSSLTISAIFERYCEWCELMNAEPIAMPTFTREFNILYNNMTGLRPCKIAGRMRYTGIILRTAAHMEDLDPARVNPRCDVYESPFSTARHQYALSVWASRRGINIGKHGHSGWALYSAGVGADRYVVEHRGPDFPPFRHEFVARNSDGPLGRWMFRVRRRQAFDQAIAVFLRLSRQDQYHREGVGRE